MKTYRAGIIGCGGIAGSHVRGLRDTGRAEVVAAWDIDGTAAQAFADTWRVPAVASASAVIDTGVDIVVIATPGFAHREYVEQAAAAGRHIVCEKPVALTMEDATAIQRAVEAAGVVCQVSFNQRNAPPFVTLWDVQQSGRIGSTVSAWARLHAPASSDRWRTIQATGHWRASRQRSGGRINEFCSHAIHWLLWVLGPPVSVYGRALHVTEGFELDDVDYALIQCRDGVGLLEVNRHAGVTDEANFGILGHAGSVVLKDGTIHLKPMDQPPVPVPLRTDVTPKHAELLDCIDRGTRPRADIDSAIETLRVCLAFNESADGNQVVFCR